MHFRVAFEAGVATNCSSVPARQLILTMPALKIGLVVALEPWIEAMKEASLLKHVASYEPPSAISSYRKYLFWCNVPGLKKEEEEKKPWFL